MGVDLAGQQVAEISLLGGLENKYIVLFDQQRVQRNSFPFLTTPKYLLFVAKSNQQLTVGKNENTAALHSTYIGQTDNSTGFSIPSNNDISTARHTNGTKITAHNYEEIMSSVTPPYGDELHSYTTPGDLRGNLWSLPHHHHHHIIQTQLYCTVYTVQPNCSLIIIS